MHFFCNDEPENLYHLFFNALTLSNEPIHLSAQNVLFGVLSKQGPLLNLLNYFIIIGKLFLWDCRRSQTLPKIQGLQSKLNIKCETEKNNNKHSFSEKKWVLDPI